MKGRAAAWAITFIAAAATVLSFDSPHSGKMLVARRVAGCRVAQGQRVARPATVNRTRCTKAMAYKVTLKTPSGRLLVEEGRQIAWAVCGRQQKRLLHHSNLFSKLLRITRDIIHAVACQVVVACLLMLPWMEMTTPHCHPSAICLPQIQ